MKHPIIKTAKLHAKRNKDKVVPWLNLSGVWLEQAGFDIGQAIQINVEDKHITITPR